MKKRIKLFVTLAVLCFSFAMLAFGVFSAMSVTYKTKGVINYDIENTYVELETRIYSTSIKFDDNATLKTYAQTCESSNFEELDSNTQTGIQKDGVTHTFNKVQIKNLNKGQDYTPVETDYKDIYSSVNATADPNPLYVALKYSAYKEDNLGIYTFIVATKIVNKSSIPLYAYVPKTGEVSYTAPENSNTYKQTGYKTLQTLNSEVYVIFAMSLDDITKPIDESAFTYPVKVSLDMEEVNKDIGDEAMAPSISSGGNSYEMQVKEQIIPTTPSAESKMEISTMKVDTLTMSAETYIDFDVDKNSGGQNLTISFGISAICDAMDITEEVSLYPLMCEVAEAELTAEEFVGMCQQMIPLSFKIMNQKSTEATKQELTAEDGVVWNITIDPTTFIETCSVTIPKNLLSDDGFSLMIYGNTSEAHLGLYAAMFTMYGGRFYLNNIYASQELSTKFKPEAQITLEATVDDPYAYATISINNIPEDVNAVVLIVSVATNAETMMVGCINGTNYRNFTMEELVGYASEGTNRVVIPREKLIHNEYTIFAIFNEYLRVDTVEMTIILTYGETELYNVGLDTDDNGNSFYKLYDVSDDAIINGVLEIPAEIDGIPVKKLYIPTKTNVTELIIPDVCRYAYEWVFAGWTNLKKVTIYNYDNYMAFDMNAFNNCTSLETIVFIGGPCSFYYEPFVNCPNLKELIYEDLFVNTSGLISGYLTTGGVVKVKCNSLSEVTNATLTDTSKFTATYDSTTGYAIFTKK